ncbi:MAG: response regulator [Candidatus Brocadiia bacterium]
MARILVVDDDEDILLFIESALEGQGHVVTGAVSAYEALEYLRQAPADLIILDLRMPGMTGLDFLDCLRKRHGRLPIVVYSSYPSLSNDFAVWDSHVVGVLTKPAAVEELVSTVKQALETAGKARPGSP